ncbi:MAG TPA: glycosyltransferase family 39 protein, partial [Tepidisphaeraceae bacterium]|nr:glycosyltransferase family 39 protein [Tepidisphaeraceae bacterium]
MNQSPPSRRCFPAILPVLLALLISIGFWLSIQCYFIPVTRGGDRNAYLLGGRMLAEGHFGGVTPPDAYMNFGQHWVEIRPGRLALKFPLGLPSIYALIDVIGGRANWPADAHELSPIAASLAVLGAFALMRPIVGDYYALLGSLLLAASPVTFFFANLPNSHATALCVAVWGMTMLLSWWRNGGAWRAVIAGLILGFNFTVRYTEGLLLLPLILVIIFAKRKTFSPGAFQKRNGLVILPLLAWLVPVSAQCLYNLLVLHHLTGYGLTHESTAFGPANFSHNWPTMLSDLYDGGLFFVLPLSVLGALLMFSTNWRLAAVL